MNLYDFGLRVPLVVRGPGLAAGIESDELVSNVDLMPTLLDLLGIEAPSLRHGHSFRPILEGVPGAKGHEFVFAEIADEIPSRELGMQERSVYDGRFHLIYREQVDRPRQVNDDLREFKRWGNRSYAETVRLKESQPLQYRLLADMDPVRLGGTPPRVELYDTLHDPWEMIDLAREPSHAARREHLIETIAHWARETGDPYLGLAKGDRPRGAEVSASP